jgi:ammonium transporter, Amt family
MSPNVAENSQVWFALCLGFVLLVPFATAGLALINTGLGRSRSAAHFMTACVCTIAVAALVYLFWGYALQGEVSPADSYRVYFGFLLGVFSVALAATIPLGAASDRWRLGSVFISAVLFAGFLYPLFARLVLRHSAKMLPMPIVDAGGSGFIHGTGGVTALVISWILGPRRGKYSAQGLPSAIPAHNAVYVLFGCMLAWVGWLGLNSAGAMLYAGSSPEKSILVALNTTMSAAAGGVTAAAVTRMRFRRPDASLIANGWVAGLVASSAGCTTLKPSAAVLTGFVAGALVVFSVEFFEFTLKVDDPCGSISVHGVCGIWGLLAAGIFCGEACQLIGQLVAVATLLGFIFPISYGLNWLVNRFIRYRVSEDGERQGLDLHELGADAYPEFVVHADEFMQR